jgi:hypothetical protein
MKITSEAHANIEKLLPLIKARLNSSGKTKATDKDNNVIYIDVDIFSNETLVQFLILSLSDFNQVPRFTHFTYESTEFVERFSEILVEGATLYALSSHALVERGRECQFVSDGITMVPPNVSDILNTQYSTLMSFHWEKLKYIKSNFADDHFGD